jgi:hypothetical protein
MVEAINKGRGSNPDVVAVVRMAPASMFGLDGFLKLAIDANNRIVGIVWARGRLDGEQMGELWHEYSFWENDVTQEQFEAIQTSEQHHRGPGETRVAVPVQVSDDSTSVDNPPLIQRWNSPEGRTILSLRNGLLTFTSWAP